MSVGGRRLGAGRKRKCDEMKIIERLDAHINPDEVIAVMLDLIRKGNIRAIQLYFNYRWGQAPQQIDVSNKDKSIANVIIMPHNGRDNLVDK